MTSLTPVIYTHLEATVNSTLSPSVAKLPRPREVTPLVETPPAATAKEVRAVEVEMPKEVVPLKLPEGRGRRICAEQNVARANNKMAVFCMLTSLCCCVEGELDRMMLYLTVLCSGHVIRPKPKRQMSGTADTICPLLAVTLCLFDRAFGGSMTSVGSRQR